MNLTHLRTFLHVAQSGGFSAAADTLDISKGMVSRHIGSLEASLQCQLFYRTTRSVTLTEAGKALLDKAQQIEDLANQAQATIYHLIQEASGTLKFTAPSALGRAVCKAVLGDYTNDYPQVNVVLNFSRQINDIEFGQFDVALRVYDEMPDNVIAKDFGYVKNILVASPKWLQENLIASVQDLAEVNAIHDSHREGWNTWQLATRTGEKASIKTQSRLVCSDYGDTQLMATLGLGVANLPRYVVEDDLAQGRLIHLFPEWHSGIHHLYLVYTRQRTYPQKVVSFIERIKQWRADHGEWFLQQL